MISTVMSGRTVSFLHSGNQKFVLLVVLSLQLQDRAIWQNTVLNAIVSQMRNERMSQFAFKSRKTSLRKIGKVSTLIAIPSRFSVNFSSTPSWIIWSFKLITCCVQCSSAARTGDEETEKLTIWVWLFSSCICTCAASISWPLEYFRSTSTLYWRRKCCCRSLTAYLRLPTTMLLLPYSASSVPIALVNTLY